MLEKITVPTLGESVTEATVSKWLKSQGDKVVADEPIVELETDKVNVEVPAPSNGILGSIAAKEGETVNVGSLLGTINDKSSKEANIAKEIKNYNPPKKQVSEEPKLFEQEIKKPAPKKINNLVTLNKDNKIKKVVICSGKIYYDLVDAREKSKNKDVVIVRLEQLYPFPAKTLASILKRYKNADFIWCQEEPKNMGGWNTVRNYIDRTLEIINFKDINVKYVGRQASSSTATGNANKHLAQQKEILEKVFKV